MVDYKLKEDILHKARNRIHIMFEGAEIHIYQDLSGITLKNRRDLKPLLDTLRAKNIPYRWKFPFGLSATFQGRTALLRVPEDLPSFCNTMGIPLAEVPNWYAEFRQSATKKEQQHEEPMEAQETRHRRRRSPSDDRSSMSTRRQHNGTSSPESPRPRRARRDHGSQRNRVYQR